MKKSLRILCFALEINYLLFSVKEQKLLPKTLLFSSLSLLQAKPKLLGNPEPTHAFSQKHGLSCNLGVFCICRRFWGSSSPPLRQ